MYLKRFVELFVVFFMTVLLSELLAVVLGVTQFWSHLFLVALVGYVILTIPLTILTVIKNRRKFVTDNQSTKNPLLKEAYGSLPNMVALATEHGDGTIDNTLIAFKPSSTNDNVWYLVTDRQTTKAIDIQQHSVCAVTTWYAKSGLRLHSNQVSAMLLMDDLAQKEISQHPEILSLSENARNQAIIKLTFSSIVVESFQKSAEVLSFKEE